MNLFILDKEEKLIGTLSGDAEKSASHFFNAKKTKELNRGYQLTFEVDMSDEGISDLIKEEHFVVFKDNDKFRLVTIKEIVDIHADDFIKEVYCEDSSIELYDEIILNEMPSTSIELEDAMKHVLSDTRWSVGEVDNVNRIKLDAEYKTKSVLEGLNLIGRAYAVEVDFSVDFVGNNIVKRSVIMKRQLGRDLGKRIEYSKDMESIKRTTDSGDIKTAVIPFGKVNEETEEMITIADVVWTKEKNGLDKPFGQIFLEDPEATKSWGYKGSNGKKRPRWIAIQYNDVEDPNELIKYANMQLASHKDPKVTYEIEAVDLYKLLDDDDYSFETVQIGDTLRIIDNAFDPPLAITSRVVKIEEYFSKTNTERKITLGNTIGSIVDKDTKTQVSELVSSLGSVNVDLSSIQAALDQLNNKTGTGVWSQIDEINQILFGEATGFHYMSEGDGIWVYDKPLNMKPTKALALKGGSLGIAKWDEQTQRWDVGTFIDGNMVNASVINTGTLHADRIGAGTITAEKLEVRVKEKIANSITQAETETLLEVKAGEINTEVSQKYSTKESVETAVNSAKQEAITSANATTDNKLQAYPTSQVVNDSINTAKGDAVKESKEYTTNTLKNYSTTSEVKSAINQKAEEITLGVASTYETKENVTTTITGVKGEVIKASKDYADTKKAEAIDTASKDATSKVNSAKTELNTAINKKANSTDVYKKSETYTKSETDSRIKVSKDEINLGVSNTYETKTNVESKITTAVSNVQVGGRNITKGTQTFTGWSRVSASDLNEKYGNLTVYHNKYTASSSYADLQVFNAITPEPNTEYTLSYWAKGTGAIINYFYPSCVASGIGSQGQKTASSDGNVMFTLSPNWTRHWVTWTTKSDVSGAKHLLVSRQMSSNSEVWICGVKLEKGNKPSDWTPAVEDVETSITTAKNEVKQYTDSAIKVAKEEINLGVSTKYETKTEVNNKINNIQVGSRNWVQNSGFKSTTGWAMSGGWSVSTTEKFRNNNSMYISRSGLTADSWRELRSNKISVKQGDTLVGSWYIKYRDCEDSIVCLWGYKADGTGRVDLASVHWLQGTNANWTRYVLKGTVPANVDYVQLAISHKRNGLIYASMPQVEYGNTVTDWSSAPEDIETAIESATTDAKKYTDAQIKVAKESIELGVKDTYETKSNVSSQVTSTLNSAKSYADNKKTEAITQAGKDADGKVASAKTELNAAIDKKANTVDVYKKTETYTKSETDSKIKVAKEEITLGVSNTYETKTDSTTKYNTAAAIAKSMSEGKMLYTDIAFRKGSNGIKTYNNTGNGNVVVDRITKPSDCPTTSTHCIRITHKGTATPHLGGFYQLINSRANAVFIQKFVAKLPVGYSLGGASNATGSGATDEWLTDNKGTGKWETYIRQMKCGATGTFSSTGFVYVYGATPSDSSPLVWYLASCTAVDITDTDERVTNLTTRMTNAEQKITNEAITNTVKQNFYTKEETNNQITDKGYQTASQVQQTVDNIVFKFNQSGGYNLLLNSRWENGFFNWNTPHSSIVRIQDGVTGLFYCRATMVAGSNHGLIQSFKQEKDRTYTASAQVDVESGAVAGVEVSYIDAGGNRRWIGANTSSNPSNFKNGVLFFTWTPDVSSEVIINFYTRGTHSGVTAGRYVRWRWTQVEQGSANTGWSPNPYEIYQGQTSINKDGIRVNASNVGTYTQMSADGFYVKMNNGNKLFEASNKVALYNGRGVSCVEIVNDPNANYGNARIDVRGGINFIHNPGQDVGLNQILLGNDDRSDQYGFHNMAIRCWNSLGFQDNYGYTNMFFDVRRGRIIMKGALYQNTATPPRSFSMNFDGEDEVYNSGFTRNQAVDSIMDLKTGVYVDNDGQCCSAIYGGHNELITTEYEDEDGVVTAHLNHEALNASLVVTCQEQQKLIVALQEELKEIKEYLKITQK